MYILLQLKKKKKRQTHKGRKGEKTTATKSWKRAISSWQDTQARSGKAEGHLDLHHRFLQRLSQCCLSGKREGFTAERSLSGVEQDLHYPYHLPSCCLRESPDLQTSGDFLKNLNQEAACPLDDPSRQEERPKDAKVCNWQGLNKPLPPAQSSWSAWWPPTLHHVQTTTGYKM